MPSRLQSKIHSDFSTNSNDWTQYRAEIKTLFDASSSNDDFNDHLIREFNRKIDRLNQSTGLYISPFDAGFRFIGDSIISIAVIGGDDPANVAEPDATAWVLMDGPLYNTEGDSNSGFIGGQSWRKMAPIGYAPYGKETYIYGDEQVRWDGGQWLYVNDTAARTFAISYDDVLWPWLATWTNNFAAAKITSTYIKTTNYPAVP